MRETIPMPSGHIENMNLSVIEGLSSIEFSEELARFLTSAAVLNNLEPFISFSTRAIEIAKQEIYDLGDLSRETWNRVKKRPVETATDFVLALILIRTLTCCGGPPEPTKATEVTPIVMSTEQAEGETTIFDEKKFWDEFYTKGNSLNGISDFGPIGVEEDAVLFDVKGIGTESMRYVFAFGKLPMAQGGKDFSQTGLGREMGLDNGALSLVRAEETGEVDEVILLGPAHRTDEGLVINRLIWDPTIEAWIESEEKVLLIEDLDDGNRGLSVWQEDDWILAWIEEAGNEGLGFGKVLAAMVPADQTSEAPFPEATATVPIPETIPEAFGGGDLPYVVVNEINRLNGHSQGLLTEENAGWEFFINPEDPINDGMVAFRLTKNTAINGEEFGPGTLVTYTSNGEVVPITLEGRYDFELAAFVQKTPDGQNLQELDLETGEWKVVEETVEAEPTPTPKEVVADPMDRATCFIGPSGCDECNLYGTVQSVRKVPIEELGIEYVEGAGDYVYEVILISPGEQVSIEQGRQHIQEVIVQGWEAKVYFAPDNWFEPGGKRRFNDEFEVNSILGQGDEWFEENIVPRARIHIKIYDNDYSENATTDYGVDRGRVTYESRRRSINALRKGEREISVWAGATFFISK